MNGKEDFDIQAKYVDNTGVIYNIIRRTIDIIGSIFGLFLLSPVFLLLAVAVKVDSEGPILFSHARLGQGGKFIKVYKFRTMVSNAEEVLKNLPEDKKKEFEKNFKLADDPRITKLGKFLRETSLDELPQLINVLKGDMTAVGPRPIVPNELKKYGKYGTKLLTVKPGLTGSWQVSGRSDTTYYERIQLDMDYIDNRTNLMDIKIAFKTVAVVFKRDGAK